jgi:ornithine cyclodeaminase/alanine dehydrogenase-like protein (mu-crystallin family)
MRVLMLSNEEIHAALSPEECERGMAAVLAAQARGEAWMPLRSVVVPPGAPGFMGLMPAYMRGMRGMPGGAGDAVGAFALKAICLMPANPGRGLDAHQGTVTVFDGETGIPTAILNASAITAIRTAAVTALATRVLAREDAGVLAILGAGVQAGSHLRALAGVRPWEEVRIYAPTAEHARAAADAAPTPRPAVASSAREAVQGADVIVAATSSKQPVFEHAWLSPGAHVNAVGASTPSAMEIEVATVAAGVLFCDSRESLRNEAGEYQLALREGVIPGDDAHIRAELGEVLAGLMPGRRDPGELTLFRSLGIGVEDLAAAEVAVEAARRLGLGTEVEL